MPCKNCERTFLPDRLVIHLRSCKPGKPLKKRYVSVVIGNNKNSEVHGDTGGGGGFKGPQARDKIITGPGYDKLTR